MTDVIAPKDFQYDEKDTILLRGAYEGLKLDDRRGFYSGLATSTVTYLLAHKTTKLSTPGKILLSLVFGVAAYNTYTHKSRTYYGVMASQLNLNASKRINIMFGAQ